MEYGKWGEHENIKTPLTSFTDLNAWKIGHELVLAVYEITKSFPKEEIFSLTSQMRRCAVSITSNIAEGFGRQHAKEKSQFYIISRGSITELQNQLIIAKDIKFLDVNTFESLFEQSITAHKLINGLIRSIKLQK